MKSEDLKTKIEADLKDLCASVALSTQGEAILNAKPEAYLALARALKETKEFAFDHLSNLTAVDYPKENKITVVSPSLVLRPSSPAHPQIGREPGRAPGSDPGKPLEKRQLAGTRGVRSLWSRFRGSFRFAANHDAGRLPQVSFKEGFFR